LSLIEFLFIALLSMLPHFDDYVRSRPGEHASETLFLKILHRDRLDKILLTI
jgi:hypothetical protein